MASLLLFSTISLAGEIKISAYCAQNDQIITVNPPRLDGFTQWVNELKRSTFDHFPCIQEIASEIERALNPEKYDITESIRAVVADYGEDAFAKKKIPFFKKDRSSHFRGQDARNLRSQIALWSCNPKLYRRNANTETLSRSFIIFNLMTVVNSFASERNQHNRENCIEGLTTFYANELLKINVTEEQCRQWPKNCQERKRDIRVITNLLSLRTDTGNEFVETWKEIKQCHSHLSTLNQRLQNLVSDLKIAIDCIPLREGEQHFVEGDQGSNTDGLYTLTRLPNGPDGKANYEIELPINFSADHGLGEYYREEASHCLQRNQKFFKGPNGENLNIKLTTAPPHWPTNQVSISSELIRSNSGQWSYSIECPTMIHEMFHLLGLADEYPEWSTGVTISQDGEIEYTDRNAEYPMYDCRSIGPRDSIMRFT